MRLPKRFWPLRRKRRRKTPHTEPVQLGLRRLEERRVLDVSAAFLNGELAVSITGDDTATITTQQGQLHVESAVQGAVTITENGNPVAITVSQVDSLQVDGDAATAQKVVLGTPLVPTKGVAISDAVETTTINSSITGVTQGTLAIDSGSIEVGADLQATVDVKLGGDVTVTNDITISGKNVTTAGTINDDGLMATGSAVVINAEAGGEIRFEGEVGTTNAGRIESLTTSSTGTSYVGADINANGSTIIFNNPVVLTSDVTLSDSGTTGIAFNSTVDSQTGNNFDLFLSATGGRVTFSGNIGATQALGKLQVEEAAEGVVFGEKAGITIITTTEDINVGATSQIGGSGITFNSDVPNIAVNVTSGGMIRLNGPTFLQTDVKLTTTGGNIEFTADAPLDSAQNTSSNLTLNAGAGGVFFNEDIGAVTPLKSLTISKASEVGFGRADSETPGGKGPVDSVTTAGPIRIGSDAVITNGITFNAGAGTAQVSTADDDILLNGKVTLESALTISTGTAGGDLRFTEAASIDSAAGENNNLTISLGDGSAQFNEDLGATNPLGTFTIQTARGGVTFGEADTEMPANGKGPVELVHAVGGIDIGAGAEEIAGTGIQLNGGGNPLTLRSDNTAIRLNGPLTLKSDASIESGGGDITFTNDTPIDSEAGENNDLSLTAGTGAVRLNEDVGSTQPLGNFDVVTAEGGVFLGESSAETPGAGTTGPVELLSTTGRVRLGRFSDVIQNGIVFQGGVTGIQVKAGTGGFLANGPVTLNSETSISTTGGTIYFTADTPIDSKAGSPQSLTLNAATGEIVFNEDIGSTSRLAGFVIEQADGGVRFGTDATEVPGMGGKGPVNMVKTDQPIDIGSKAAIGGRGIILHGGANELLFETTGDDIRFHGMVLLQGALTTVSTMAGAGNVTFTKSSTINSFDGVEATTKDARNDLKIGTGEGSVRFNANIGDTQRLGELTVTNAAGGVAFGNSAAGPDNGIVTEVLTSEEVNIGSDSVITGGIVFDGGGSTLVVNTHDPANTDGGKVSLNGPATLNSDLKIATGAKGGDFSASGATTIDSQKGEANDLTIDLGQGKATVEAAIGGSHTLGKVDLVSLSDATFDGSLSAGSLVQQAGSGTTTFNGPVATSSADGINLIGNEFAINAAVTTTGGGGVTIMHNGLLVIAAAGDMNLDGAFVESGAGDVQTAGDIKTSGADITFNSNVTLTDAATVFLEATGGKISFKATLGGESEGQENLTINAGATGTVSFEDALGGSKRLGDVLVQNTQDLTFMKGVTATSITQQAGTGTTSFQGTVNTNDPTQPGLDLVSNKIEFQQAVNTTGNGQVVLTVGDTLTIESAADFDLTGSFTQRGTGATTNLSADLTTSNAGVLFAGLVNVLEDSTIKTARMDGDPGGAIEFQKALQGTATVELTTNSGLQATTFGGAVGPFALLTIEDAGDVTFAENAKVTALVQEAGTGTTTFEKRLDITGGQTLTLVTDSVILATGGVIDTHTIGNAAINIDAASNVTINGSVNSGSQTTTLEAGKSIQFGSMGTIKTDNADVEVRPLGGNPTLTLNMDDGSSIEVGNGQINLETVGSMTISRLVSTRADMPSIQLTSTAGGVRDGGDSGVDIEAPTVTFDVMTGVGTGNPLEVVLARILPSATQTGGFHLVNQSASPLTLGRNDASTTTIQHGSVGLNEIQTVTVGNGRAGTFTLEFAGETTGPIPFDANTSTVQNALLALNTIGPGNVVVRGTAGGPWEVEFQGSLANTDVPSLVVDASGVTGIGTVNVRPISSNPVANAIQQVALQNTIGGTFTLAFNGQVTGGLAFDSTAAQIQAALEGLSTIGAGGATVTGNAGGPWTVHFTNLAVALPLIVADGGNLVGPVSTSVVVNEKGVGNDEVQEVRIENVTGGTFRLSFDGAKTTDLAFDVSAMDLETALEALSITLSGVDTSLAGNVRVTGGGGMPWRVEFINQLAGRNLPRLQMISSLTGGLVFNSEAFADNVPTVATGLRATRTGTDLDNPGLANDFDIRTAGLLHVAGAIENYSGGNVIFRSGAGDTFDLIIDAPIQARGGNGSIILFAGNDLIVNHSLPDQDTTGNTTNPATSPDGIPVEQRLQEAEISTDGTGIIRGQARREVIVEDGFEEFTETEEGVAVRDQRVEDFVIFRTRAERSRNDTSEVISHSTDNSEQEIILRNVASDTFTLSYQDRLTSSLSVNSTADQVRGALEGLPAIPAGSVTVTGPSGGPWTVTFTTSGVSLLGIAYDNPTIVLGADNRNLDPLNSSGDFDSAAYNAELTRLRGQVSPQITHVPPLLRIQPVDLGGSTIDAQGRAILQVRVGDPLDFFFHEERNFHLTIYWGDGTSDSFPVGGNPSATRDFLTPEGSSLVREPDATKTGRFDRTSEKNGVTSFDQGVYFFHHRYLNPPDQPEQEIIVRAELRYDARVEGEVSFDTTLPSDQSGIFNGIRFFQNVSQEVFTSEEVPFQTPGIPPGVVVVESIIIPPQLRLPEATLTFTEVGLVGQEIGNRIEFGVSQFESQTFEDYRLFLKVVDDVTGNELPEEYALPIAVLEDPIGLFEGAFTNGKPFPDGHYRIFLEEIATRRVRMIVDVHVSQGTVVAGDFREGAERQRGLMRENDEAQPQNDQEAPPEDAGAAVLPAAADQPRQAAMARGERAEQPRGDLRQGAVLVGATTVALRSRKRTAREEVDAALENEGAPLQSGVWLWRSLGNICQDDSQLSG